MVTVRIILGALLIIAAIPASVIILQLQNWPFSIAGNFVMQGYIGAFLVSIAAFFLKRIAVAMFAAMISIFSLGITHVATLPLTIENNTPIQDNDIPPSSQKIRIIHANLMGRDKALARLIEWGETAKPDIITLTEIPNGAPESRRLNMLFADYPYRTFSHKGGPARTLIASRYPITDHQSWNDYVARAVVSPPNEPQFAVFSIHPPPPWTAISHYVRNKTIERAFQVAQQENLPSILVGDFNATPWTNVLKDPANTNGFIHVSYGLFSNSWMSKIPGLGLPIDHIYATEDFHNTKTSVGPSIGSDHYPLITELYRIEKKLNYLNGLSYGNTPPRSFW